MLFISCGKQQAINYNIPHTIETGKVVFAGVRSSSYGIKPFPDPREWQHAVDKMAGYYEGAAPCAIWIVGRFKGPKGCLLEFPSDGRQDANIFFSENDKHESYLNHFDSTGIKVFLQVEPGHACVDTLIYTVLNRYRHHPCVIGFGVDVEWYREADHPKWGVKVADDSAKAWETRVKSYYSNYRLFLKHWDRDWMPSNYRGDIIFVDDSQMHENFERMVEEFVVSWADYFKPNIIFYQIGYRSDRPWWEQLDSPPKDIGMTIASNIDQQCGIFWVDFTLRDVLLSSIDSVTTNQN